MNNINYKIVLEKSPRTFFELGQEKNITTKNLTLEELEKEFDIKLVIKENLFSFSKTTSKEEYTPYSIDMFSVNINNPVQTRIEEYNLINFDMLENEDQKVILKENEIILLPILSNKRVVISPN